MMSKVVIIEDEVQASVLLKEMLSDINPLLVIADVCRDLPSGVKSIRRHAPDIVFLDIELPVYSGIQLLDFFNSEEITFHIIFTTAYSEYAIRAFEMSAVDYLMKPLGEEKLRVALHKAAERLQSPKPDLMPLLKENLQPGGRKKIVVPVTNGFEILQIEEICYCKAEGSYTELIFRNGNKLMVSKNLKHFEFILYGHSYFVRVHRSYLVNVHCIRKIIRRDGIFLLLDNGTELPLSEDKVEKMIGILQQL